MTEPSTNPTAVSKLSAKAMLRRGTNLLKILLSLGVCLVTFIFSRAQEGDPGTAYQFSFIGIDGNYIDLADYAGKTLLIVNTASRCGFTKQYDDLQKLYDTYKDQGLVVLGVPSNDFGGQEPGADGEIKQFCEINFNINFPMAGKTVVSGANAHPFYHWAASQVNAFGRPRWNFHKYLINPEGKLVDWFSSMTSPMDSKVTASVERWLPAALAKPALAEPIAAE